ncbi:MAG: NAD-dependent epimerase/dehydratase family protein [Nonlabens sp.]
MRLVTGATGLVGGHLLYRFRESATTTIALYRNIDHIEKTRFVFACYDPLHADLVDNFIWKPADILEVPSLDEVMPGVKEVYHCAAALKAPSFEQLKRVNIMGTENVVNVALAHGVKKFCHVSSIAALGDSVGSQPISEEDFFNLDANNTDYAISKYGAEMEAWRATQEGMDVVIVNPGIILGAGSWDNSSGQLFSKMDDGNKFYTSGASGFVDVRDVVEIMQHLMESDIINERFILVAENCSYKNILDGIAREFGVKRPSFKIGSYLLSFLVMLSFIKSIFTRTSVFRSSNVQSLVSKTRYSNMKIKDQLGYEFRDVAETISRVCDLYRTH